MNPQELKEAIDTIKEVEKETIDAMGEKEYIEYMSITEEDRKMMLYMAYKFVNK